MRICRQSKGYEIHFIDIIHLPPRNVHCEWLHCIIVRSARSECCTTGTSGRNAVAASMAGPLPGFRRNSGQIKGRSLLMDVKAAHNQERLPGTFRPTQQARPALEALGSGGGSAETLIGGAKDRCPMPWLPLMLRDWPLLSE